MSAGIAHQYKIVSLTPAQARKRVEVLRHSKAKAGKGCRPKHAARIVIEELMKSGDRFELRSLTPQPGENDELWTKKSSSFSSSFYKIKRDMNIGNDVLMLKVQAEPPSMTIGRPEAFAHHLRELEAKELEEAERKGRE